MSSISFDIQLINYRDTRYVLIDARVSEEVSSGFLATETVDDIFELRDAIDAFIVQNNLIRTTEK